MNLSAVLKGVLLSAAVCWTTVNGQHQPKSEVTLSLDEFQELFSSARLKDAERHLLDQRKIQEAEHNKKLKELEASYKSFDAEIRRQSREMFPDNFQVLKHTASGIFNRSSPIAGVEGDVASFDLELTLRVMESSQWTAVPLVNTSSTVAANWQVSLQEDDGSDDDDEFCVIDPVTDPRVLLFIRNDQQVLATNQSGLFKIKFNAYTRVGKTRNLNTMGLSSLLYPFSDFSFRIVRGASSGSIRGFSVQPAASVLQVHPFKEYTDMKATLPLTADSIQIRWTDVQEEETDDQTQEEVGSGSGVDHKSKGDTPQVAATHEVMHTIGEGIIRSVHNLEFKTTSEMSPLSSVQFVVHGDGVRVTSVAGHALQSWTVEKTTADPAHQSNLVKAHFKTSQIDSSVVLQVHTEMDRDDPDEIEEVELPRIECRNVIRQTGHIAVIKDANVEVHERKTSGLSRCEPSDLSSKLRLNVDRPIVLSYKYLNPQNSAVLSVKEHAAMETLEATIDRVHYKSLVTSTHIVHSVILHLQSTKLQYLEMLGLPPTASKFTVMVNSVPVKPVKGKAGDDESILIPLLIGLDSAAANEGNSLRTSIEVTYFSTHDDALGHNGTISLNPPRFDLPISVLTTHLLLPRPYKYEFSGDFGSQSLDKLDYPAPEAFSYTKGKRVIPGDYEFSVVDDIWPEDSNGNNVQAVKMMTPRAGRSFYFQHLLVVDKGLELNVTYIEAKPLQEKKKYWWEPLFRK